MIEEYKAKYQELAAKKRAELEGALEAGKVHDPFSSAFLISLAISAAVSAASYVVSMAFAPKPPKQTIGKLQGSLQIQNSEQGIMIPEIYGAGPAASLVAGANPTYQNLTNTTGGANGSITKTSGANNNYNAGASHNVAVTTGQDAFIRVIRGAGFAAAGFFNTASPTGSGPNATGMIFGVAWHNAGPFYPVINGVGFEQGNTISGDTFTIEYRSGRFRLYKNSAEITTFGAAVPPATFPMYFGVIMYTTGAGVSNAKIKINAIGDPPNFAKGGVKVPAIIDWSSGIRKNVSVTEHQVGGKGFMGGQSQTTENISYDIDLGLSFARGELSLLRLNANADVLIDQMDTSLLLTGAYDPTVGPDADYDHELPPDARDNYAFSIDRWNNDIPFDGDGVGTGSIQGGATGFAVYSGSETQDPDPTEEADIDAKFGTGSTPAHRGKARVVLSNFDLSKWGGIVPNMTAAWEHPTLTNLSLIYASLCERVNVKTATSDYDFTGISTIQPRGMLIAGRLFSPAEVIGSPDIQTVYNYQVTEAEGQIIGWIEGAEPSVTIPDTDIGWMNSDDEVSDILPEVDTILASEIGLARQVDVKFINLDKEWEPDTQSDNRQITEGVSTEVVEVQLALLASEARTAAQRKLYRDYVAGSVHKFTLSYQYMYLYPGYKVTITRAEGFNHVLKLTSISGGLGVLECEGVAIEPAAFTQPATGSIAPGFPPNQPVPAMTVLSLLDTPLLRDGDETNNNGVGFYACGTPRTGVDQAWTGFALYRNRNGVWGLIGSSNLPGTIGTIVSAVGLSSDTTVKDDVGVFTVDLYGAGTLASVTTNDLLMDISKNMALFGDMVSKFTTATQVPDFPNRWTISGLLNGRRGTEGHIGDTFTGKRFVLINEAVKFIPIEVTDLNNELEYRAVTSGQSLADAATVEFVWTGGAIRPLAPVNIRGDRDAANNLLAIWTRRTRVSQGLRDLSEVPLAEERDEYRVEAYNGSTLVRTMISVTGMSMPSVFEIPGGTKGSTITTSSLTPSVGRSFQVITQAGNYIEATLNGATNTDVQAGIGIVSPAANWTDTSGGISPPSAPEYEVVLAYNGSVQVLTVYRFGVSVSTLSGVANAERVRITLTGSEIRFTRDWVGPGTPPFYIAPIAPTYPYHAFGHARGNGVLSNGIVQKVVMTINPQPGTVYSAAQQTQDGLTPGDPVKLRVMQLSATVGPGDYAENTI